MSKYIFGFHILIFTCALLLASTSSRAQDRVMVLAADESVNEMVTEEDQTHPPVKLTPDRSEILRLKQKAKTVIVGNPAHLSVLAETPTTLILVAKIPGATHFTVLDEDGQVVMQRHVIVASPKKNYVRLRKSCAASEDESCQSTSMYYCPDKMCHEVRIMAEESEGGSAGGGDAAGEAEAEQLEGMTDQMAGGGNGSPPEVP